MELQSKRGLIVKLFVAVRGVGLRTLNAKKDFYSACSVHLSVASDMLHFRHLYLTYIFNQSHCASDF